MDSKKFIFANVPFTLTFKASNSFVNETVLEWCNVLWKINA